MRSSGWMFSLVLVAHAAASGAPMEITVQIFNNANAPQLEIRQAEREAGWMFQKAGIAVHWVECPLLMRERGGDQVCRETDDPGLFVVSINAVDPPEQSDTALGFALIGGRANHAAAVYPRIAAQTQNDPEYRDCVLLGSVLAHELAHLLFRSTRHGEGIMQPNWTRRDYQAMTQRRMVFTSRQAQALRRMLALRIEVEGQGNRVVTHCCSDNAVNLLGAGSAGTEKLARDGPWELAPALSRSVCQHGVSRGGDGIGLDKTSGPRGAPSSFLVPVNPTPCTRKA